LPRSSPHFSLQHVMEYTRAKEFIKDHYADESISFFKGQCRVRVANCFELRHRVYRFQYQTYEKLRIAEPKRDGLWVTLHDALPETTTLIAEDSQSKLAGVLTLVLDSPIGLPADSLFPSEMKMIRKPDSHICELISFGTSEKMRGSVKILAGLLYCSYLFALHARRVTDFVITVHERYERFYCSNLLFSRTGPLRNYEKVNGEPTVLLHLPLRMPDELRQSRRIFPLSLFSYSKPQEQAIASIIDLMTTPMTLQEFKSFFIENTDIWNKATFDQKEFIHSIYASDS
jgi:hypothetical protein